jgi:[FeFe] hydrogenase H-cluster maturation GTPase HydF
MGELQQTPGANRLHIAVYGKRNAGKSSIINAISGQQAALVSEVAGTTTDPVYRPMELLPIGPVMLVDTAGLDDEGAIGDLRMKRTRQVMDKTDLALLVFVPDSADFTQEMAWYEELKLRRIPIIGVINKSDLHQFDSAAIEAAFPIPFVRISALYQQNIAQLKEFIIKYAPTDYEEESILGNLVQPGDVVVLVMPQDIQAPKGRLILPQVQVMRELLDRTCICIATVTTQLAATLDKLTNPPDLVITDSQVFDIVDGIIPRDVLLTSFSLLMASYKGDFALFAKGGPAIDALRPGDCILVAEACTHHSLEGDIGREKLPKWLAEKAGGPLAVDVVAGVDFPDDLSRYKLILHCGGCMQNRRQILSRQLRAESQGVPMTNYGIAIAHLRGILPRVVIGKQSK